MQVKDQIQLRREQLGLTMKQLADRVGVTEQAVRHWESGRSFPGKSKMSLVEQALNFSLDWSEGAHRGDHRKTARDIVDEADVKLLLLISRLPPKLKALLSQLATAYLEDTEVSAVGARQEAARVDRNLTDEKKSRARRRTETA
jgi:transcriptional regulator with XRE-family HTH domain